MSVLKELLKKKAEQKGFLFAIGGLRLAGKSTIAGTLPGKTLIMQPAGIEAGNTAPVKLAKERGNHVDIVEFNRFQEAFELLTDPGLASYNNLYIDGISAFTEQVYSSPEFETISKKNKWDGFDFVKDQSTKLITMVKDLTYSKGMVAGISYALKSKLDDLGNLVSVEMVAKGNATKAEVEGKFPNVLALVAVTDESGKLHRRLLTQNNGPYVARLGNMLDSENPKVMEDDLGKLLQYMKIV